MHFGACGIGPPPPAPRCASRKSGEATHAGVGVQGLHPETKELDDGLSLVVCGHSGADYISADVRLTARFAGLAASRRDLHDPEEVTIAVEELLAEVPAGKSQAEPHPRTSGTVRAERSADRAAAVYQASLRTIEGLRCLA